MTVAVHQPYFFPYAGYFQLIQLADTFVFLDDVGFRKQGWVNRNRIAVAGRPRYFTVPVSHARSSTPIRETMIDRAGYPEWRRRFIRTLSESYAHAPGRPTVLALVEEALALDGPDIGALAERSVRLCCTYLDLEPRFATSSVDFPAPELRGVDRLLDICRRAGASTYVNAPGGRTLYDPEVFARAGVALRFLVPVLDRRPCSLDPDDPSLSILDSLMWLDRDRARRAVRQGRLS